MYKILFTLSLFFIPFVSFASVARESTTNGDTTTPPSVTISSPNSVLLVTVRLGTDVDSVSFDGQSLSHLYTHIGSGSYGASTWVLYNPNVTSASLVTSGGSGVVVATVYEGAQNDFTNLQTEDSCVTCSATASVSETGGMVYFTMGTDGIPAGTSGFSAFFSSNSGQFQVGDANTTPPSTTQDFSGVAEGSWGQLLLLESATPTTTTPTTTIQYINYPNHDLFNGFILFFIAFFGIQVYI